MLRDKGIKQGIHGTHDAGGTADLEWAVLLDGANSSLFDIPRHYSGKRAPQLRGKQMALLIPV